MAKTRSMARNQYPGAAPWLDLNHDALFLVMMQLGVVDFVAFSGVCKSWRSFALSNWPNFMASKPPMFIRISPPGHKDACYLIDFQGRKFKTIIRAILVFSPSISEWTFVLVDKYSGLIWFSIAGKDAWNHALSTSSIWDLHAFNGKIYILSSSWLMMNLHELKLNPEPKLTLLNIKNFRKPHLSQHLLSSNENVHFVGYNSEDKNLYTVHELDFDRMKWVMCEKTSEEYAFFLSDLQNCVAVKQELAADPCLQRGKYIHYKKSGKGRFFTADMWYFPNDYLNVNCIDE